MEQVEDAVGVHPDGPPDGGRVGLEAAGRVGQLADGRQRHGFLVIGLVKALEGELAAFAADALGNVDAGLGGVARLARVEGVVGATAGSLPLRIRAAAVGVSPMRASGPRGRPVALLARGVARRRLLRAVGHVVRHVCRRGGRGRSLALGALGRAGDGRHDADGRRQRGGGTGLASSAAGTVRTRVARDAEPVDCWPARAGRDERQWARQVQVGGGGRQRRDGVWKTRRSRIRSGCGGKEVVESRLGRGVRRGEQCSHCASN